MFWLGFSGLPRRVHDYPVIFMGWQGMATTGHLITLKFFSLGILILFILFNAITIIFNIAISSLINISLMLSVTLIIASLTLMERKILSLMQRRVGPYFVGYKGRLQYIADALKLFVKGTLIPEESNKF